MTDRELMQMALDALEYVIQSVGGNAPESFDVWFQKTQIPAEALRARLAQPEQEPVAWITDGGKGELWWHQSVKFDVDGNLIGENPDDIPLYTAPPQQHSEQWWRHEVSNAWAEGYEKGRASVKQPEQEPVATLFGSLPVYDVPPPEQEPVACPYCHYSHTLGAVYFDQNCAGCVKRMTAPPQREWQGLTDEEVKAAWSQLWYDLGNGKFAASDDPARHTTIMFAKEIEAKLKEKNT